MSKPAFEPAYQKPDEPGVSMNFDNTVSLYHVVRPSDTFEEAARAVFEMIRDAQSRYPGWPRVLYLDIDGHSGPNAGFDEDFLEFQQELLFSTMAPFLTAFETPLTGGLVNPDPQRNDLPDELVIRDSPPGEPS
ncbi:MAG: hypothetical protein R3178_03175 [Rhodothermales bacterium]|nr:hypothetical protein [Rhodothermales bacterium]